MKALYINAVSSWQPPAGDPAAAPKLEWTEPNFRRRLSRLTKMTVQAVHDLFEKCGKKDAQVLKTTKLVFASMRGELEREFKINQTLIQDKEILPAPFSLSTFNAAIAQATIALGLKGGYSAVYPAHAPGRTDAAFKECILAAAAPLLAGEEKETVFVYADENIPDYYREVCERDGGIRNNPLAFAALLSSQKTPDSVELDLENLPARPEDFLKL